MFESILVYQIVDLLLAAAIVGLLVRGAPSRASVRLARRFPRALATPFRRLALVKVPAFTAAILVFAVLGEFVVFRLFDKLAAGHPRLQRAANVGLFVVLGIAFQGFAVVLPLVGLWRAWRKPRAGDTLVREPEDAELAAKRRRTDRWVATAAFVVVTGVAVHATFIEPNRLVVEEVDVGIEGWPQDKPPLRVVLLADLQSAHLGERERRVPEIVAKLAPDLIVVAGDLVSPTFDESLAFEQARWVLSRLSAPLGVHVVNGDVDEVVEGGARKVVEGTPVNYLDNESVVIPSDPPFELIGVDPRDLAAFNAVLASPPRAPIRIGLVHRPRYYAHLGKAGCQFVLAGHTHGGQVVVPGFGPIMTYEILPRRICAGGLHRMPDGTQLYVTRGLGLEGGFAPPVRLFCPPEITLLRLGPPATDLVTEARERR